MICWLDRQKNPPFSVEATVKDLPGAVLILVQSPLGKLTTGAMEAAASQFSPENWVMSTPSVAAERAGWRVRARPRRAWRGQVGIRVVGGILVLPWRGWLDEPWCDVRWGDGEVGAGGSPSTRRRSRRGTMVLRLRCGGRVEAESGLTGGIAS